MKTIKFGKSLQSCSYHHVSHSIPPQAVPAPTATIIDCFLSYVSVFLGPYTNRVMWSFVSSLSHLTCCRGDPSVALSVFCLILFVAQYCLITYTHLILPMNQLGFFIFHVCIIILLLFMQYRSCVLTEQPDCFLNRLHRLTFYWKYIQTPVAPPPQSVATCMPAHMHTRCSSSCCYCCFVSFSQGRDPLAIVMCVSFRFYFFIFDFPPTPLSSTQTSYIIHSFVRKFSQKEQTK